MPEAVRPSAPQPPAPPPPRRRSGIGFVIMLLLLLFSIVGNLVLFLLVLFFGAAAMGGASGEPSDDIVAQTIHKGSPQIIAIVPVSGTVDESMTDQMFKYCEYLKKNPNIRGVVLEVDTPGGGITASDEIHHLFTNLKGSGKRVVVSMRSLAASGGYYISMPADKIYAQPTSLTGSIGVIWPAFEVTELMDKVGVNTEFIKSTSSNEFKDAGSPFKQFTEKDRAYIRNLVDQAQAKFTQVVEDGRKGKLTVPVANVAVGKIFTADEALKLGLIDEIAYLDEVCNKTAAELGLGDATIVRLGLRAGLLDALLTKGPMGAPKVELKVDPKMIEQLTTPRMQYKAPALQ